MKSNKKTKKERERYNKEKRENLEKIITFHKKKMKIEKIKKQMLKKKKYVKRN